MKLTESDIMESVEAITEQDCDMSMKICNTIIENSYRFKDKESEALFFMAAIYKVAYEQGLIEGRQNAKFVD